MEVDHLKDSLNRSPADNRRSELDLIRAGESYSTIQDQRQALLAAMIRERKYRGNGASREIPRIPRMPGAYYPLSYAQLGLWIAEQVNPVAASYNQLYGWTVPGKLRLDALEAGLTKIVERHEILRTRFVVVNGQPMQMVDPVRGVVIEVTDLGLLSSTERKQEVQRIVYEEVSRVFDLPSGPLVRTRLLQLDEAEQVLLFTAHHIAVDGWSLGILMQELGELYTARVQGRSASLPGCNLQYADYASWERESSQADESAIHLKYWREQLEDISPLDLPTDRVRPPQRTFRGANRCRSVPGNLRVAIEELSRQEKTTIFMTLLAGFEIVLTKYSGQETIAVGSPIATRSRFETERLLGCFVNMLVLPARFHQYLTVRGLLAQTRETCLNAYAHQDLSFEKLLETLAPERDGSRSPLFQVTFAVDNSPQQQLVFDEMRAEPLVTEAHTCRFDLELSLDVRDGQLVASMFYKTDLFEGITVERMLRHYERVLEAMVAAPDRLISSLPLLDDEETRQIVKIWNQTDLIYPRDKCVHELFQDQANSASDAVAVEQERAKLTYGDLNRKANQLAHYLKKKGIKPETRVGICIDRSLLMAVGILGVLKAGGAYVPLDSEYPAERLEYMIKNAGAEVLLTQERLKEALPACETELVCLDRDWGLIDKESGSNVSSPVVPDNLAYVIYTSGSTGKPKGVMVSHRSLMNHTWWMQSVFGFDQQDRVLQKSPFGFDASVLEFFAPLLGCSTLVMARPSGQQDADYLRELIRDSRITTIQLVPSLLRALLHAGGFKELSSLRRVLCGGEVLSSDLEQTLLSQTNAQVYNLYGPTEATVDASGWKCQRDSEGPTVPIGRPIANAQLYVLDAELRPVPVGVSGELYIGGEGVARGYQNRPDLTAERFVPDPFSGEPSARLYRTGDWVRYRADRNLYYIGRVDEQVKIRGNRVELGEIEEELRKHPAVKETIVFVREDISGEKRLVAYVVPTMIAIDGFSTRELRGFLRQRLPEYMVPASFVAMGELPLTAHGKVNRKALPRPELTRFGSESRHVSPRNREETILAGIWSEILHIEQVGVEDNFFELGGDSILGIQIVAAADRAGFRLSVRSVFEHPTIAELAVIACKKENAVTDQKPVNGPVGVTPIQDWFFEQDFVDSHHYNQAVLLEIDGGVDIGLLHRAVAALVTHHDTLRLRFIRRRSGWSQVNADAEGNTVSFSLDLSAVPTDTYTSVLRFVTEQIQTSLDLTRGPLLRVIVLNFGEAKPSQLLIVVHHLVIDGVSWRILLDDLQTGYEQLSRSEKLLLPTKTTSFTYWAALLSFYARSEEIGRELSYWQELSQRKVINLPRDFCLGANTEGSSRCVTTVLSMEETRALLQDVPVVYRTQINDVLLAALVEAFSDLTGARRLLLDMEGHGREELLEGVDLSRTVGWFTTLYPVMLDLTAITHPGDVLRFVKEQLRSIPKRGIGYGLLRYMSDETTAAILAAVPEREVSFNYVGQIDSALRDKSLFKWGQDPIAPCHSERAKRTHLIEVSGSISNEALTMSWTFSANIHRHSTIEGLAHRFVDALRLLIAHCQSSAGSYTPSDFPGTQLGQSELDRLGTPQEVENICPLTPVQEGMLFHSLHTPNGGEYVEQLSCVLGTLHAEVFREAWQATISRHGILRACFVWEEVKKPIQVVKRTAEMEWVVEDWRKLTEPQMTERLQEFLVEDRSRGFEVSKAPLMRVRLFRTTDEDYQFVWTHHHMLLDGWSMSLLLKEVFEYYDKRLSGQENKRPPDPRPYRDYVAWVQKQDKTKSEIYWKEQLKNFEEPTSLRRGVSDYRMGEAAVELCEIGKLVAPEIVADLQTISQRHGLTLNTIVQGAWAILLSRYSGKNDVVFGATTSGRSGNLPGIESMLGLFINTLPVFAKVVTDRTVVEWLKELQERQIEARQYEYTSLAEIQGWSKLPRGQPLFDNILVFENYPIDRIARTQLKELGVRDICSLEKNNYPLTVVVAPGEELWVHATYSSTHYEADTIERMVGHYVQLLKSIAANPDRKLWELSALEPRERYQILEEWNTPTKRHEGMQCIPEWFEVQAGKNPEAVAVVCEGELLTYGELNRRSNQLARYLLRQGVGPEVLVGIFMERSLDMVVAIIGLLKAGGAYVPIDSEYPGERISYILQDATVRVLLVAEETRGKVPNTHGTMLVSLNGNRGVIAGEDPGNLSPRADPDNIAYVIYTSGSTGKPKGVQISHRNVLRLMMATEKWFGFNERDVFTLFHSYAFDFSVWELWSALLYGGRLVVVPYFTSRSPETFVGLLRTEGVTVLNQTPSAFRQLMQLEETTGCCNGAALRVVIFGGEALDLSLIRPWIERHGDKSPRLVNMYGITETTVHVTYRQIISEDVTGKLGSVIGNPIPDLTVYVLDREMCLVPIGVMGELYVGGDGLARGYLNRPDLTAERFVPNPFGRTAGERLYKTGDLGRYLPDGDLEYLGRCDTQVKIHGFRIELGEIESVLQEHPKVALGVAVMGGKAGAERLLAYVVDKDKEQQVTDRELREHLQGKLPGYLVPVAYLHLTELPLNEHGKLDRKKLPAFDVVSADLGQTYVAPRSREEQELAGIWEQVLGLERVGANDNFFELGGDSILSIQIVARANQAGHRLTVKQMFQHPTVAELAAIESAAPVIDTEQEVSSGAVPLTAIQYWFFEQAGDTLHHYNQAILLEVGPGADFDVIEKAIRHLLEHHDALRSRFHKQGSQWGQEIAESEAHRVCTAVDFSQLSPDEQSRTLEEIGNSVQASLDLENGPLVRVAYFDYGLGRAGRLLLVVHHLAIDGVSWRVLLEDLHTAYEQVRQGRGIELPAKTTPFKKWAERIHKYAESDEMCSELSYWMAQISEHTGRVPVDLSEGDNTENSLLSVMVSLNEGETHSLLHDVPSVYRTEINDLLLSALAKAVTVWTGDSRVLIDVEGHGRGELFEKIDLSRTVGWFTTMFPLALELGKGLGPGEVLKSIKEQVRRTPHQGIGYGVLRYLARNMEVRERLRKLPQAEISFNYLGQFDPVLPEGGLFRWAAESCGRTRDPRFKRSHLLEIGGWITGRKLSLSFMYSRNRHRRENIEKLAQNCIEILRDLISHCQLTDAGGYTPSDFPEAGLDQEELNKLMSRLTGS